MTDEEVLAKVLGLILSEQQVFRNKIEEMANTINDLKK